MKSKKLSAKFQGKQPLNLKSNPSAIFISPKVSSGVRLPGFSKQSTQTLRSSSFKKMGARYLYTNEELLSILRKLKRHLGRVPEMRDLAVNKGALAGKQIYYDRFGSLLNALRLAGIKTKYHTREIK